MKYNYHTHTYRCHHAAPDERAYIESAISAGIETLGFADHSPYFFDGDYYSNYRMRPETAYEYFDTLSKLREEYKDRINIKIGFETEYYPRFFHRVIDFYKNFDVDFIILGQHFLDNEMGSHYSGSPTNDEYYLEKYINQVSEALDTGKYTYVAHPDLLNYTGDFDIYRKHYIKLCEKSYKLNIPLEINFLGIADNRIYPNEKFWEIAGEVGAPVVLGVDAHTPKALNNTDVLAKAMQLCDKYNLNLQENISLIPV